MSFDPYVSSSSKYSLLSINSECCESDTTEDTVKIKCDKCFNLKKEPVIPAIMSKVQGFSYAQPICNHSFCEKCIESLNKCPVCNSDFTTSITDFKALVKIREFLNLNPDKLLLENCKLIICDKCFNLKKEPVIPAVISEFQGFPCAQPVCDHSFCEICITSLSKCPVCNSDFTTSITDFKALVKIREYLNFTYKISLEDYEKMDTFLSPFMEEVNKLISLKKFDEIFCILPKLPSEKKKEILSFLVKTGIENHDYVFLEEKIFPLLDEKEYPDLRKDVYSFLVSNYVSTDSVILAKEVTAKYLNNK